MNDIRSSSELSPDSSHESLPNSQDCAPGSRTFQPGRKGFLIGQALGQPDPDATNRHSVELGVSRVVLAGGNHPNRKPAPDQRPRERT
jgi:hypothetical protein